MCTPTEKPLTRFRSPEDAVGFTSCGASTFSSAFSPLPATTTGSCHHPPLWVGQWIHCGVWIRRGERRESSPGGYFDALRRMSTPVSILHGNSRFLKRWVGLWLGGEEVQRYMLRNLALAIIPVAMQQFPMLSGICMTSVLAGGPGWAVAVVEECWSCWKPITQLQEC